MKKGIINIKVNNNLISRQEIMDNQGYTVYPVIMMNEGVHNDVLYSLSELSKFFETWNGRPVPILHPEADGNPISANSPDVWTEQSIGTVFNSHMDGTSLKAEIWLTNDKLNTLAPDVRDFLQTDGQMDVSTGLFCEEIIQSGVFKNMNLLQLILDRIIWLFYQG